MCNQNLSVSLVKCYVIFKYICNNKLFIKWKVNKLTQEFDGVDDLIICFLWDEKCFDKMKRLLYNFYKFIVYFINLLQKVNLFLLILKIESFLFVY